MMGIERALEDARNREVPWDEVRERRVLARVRGGVGRRRGVDRRGMLAAGAVAVAAAAVAVVALWPVAPQPVAEQPQIAAVAPPVAAAPERSVLQLADGSAATLAPGAQVEVVLQTADAVELRQSAGEVRYDVVPDTGRRLTVNAAGVAVRVVGTVFTVGIADDHVDVAVVRGQVEVDDGQRVSQLGADHRLSVPIPGTAPAPQAPEEPAAGADAPPAAPQRRPATRKAPRERAEAVSIDALLEQADAARRARDWDRAAALLRKIVELDPGDARSGSALFTLGRVERSRRRHTRAAAAFRSCRTRAPKGPLAEDALAEEATSWADAGADDRARAAATVYLDRYRDGTHARRMRAILAPSP